jgi:hypothetical protein
MKHEGEVSRQPRRRDRLLRERIHDPYKTRLKVPEPTGCPQWGAVFHEGRWRWAPPPEGAHGEVWQACRRINNRYPAGEVKIGGGFAARHRQEIVLLARHQELHRIMSIDDEDGSLMVRTTDIHLPRRIGEALRHAYHGDLEFHYDEEVYFHPGAVEAGGLSWAS